MKLNVPDMSCGHCKASVEAAIAAIDAGAHIDVDLAAKTVNVTSSATADKIISALAGKGFLATLG